MTTFRMIMGRIWRPIAASALVLLLTISVHKARQYGFSRLIIVTVLLVLVPIFDALLLNLFFTLKLIRRLKRHYGANEQRSALRGTSRFGFAGVHNAPNIELGLSKHKERARVSPLGFS